ncbi:HEPN domain-containing protein [Luteimonas mephitis]|uniref:HEPN domain-containing protein n=1 Tax=Luteimonas mephitis TaxID=83615 RepID=UPI000419C7CE|nr:HEPN domain-containing protein [Luteimonas mephitis]
MPTAAELKARHRGIRDAQPEALRVRIHRAISWLARAERETGDPDARFLFLWIAFNAAYASEFSFEHSEREQARMFVAQLLAIDPGHRLHHVLYDQFTGPIRTLVENRFVFEPFWKALREHDSSERWAEQFAGSKRVAMKALMAQETAVLLSIVLDRLHVLRNQLVHGGATWNGAANRAQVGDAARIMGALVPTVILLMMEGGVADFGEIAFPLLAG